MKNPKKTKANPSPAEIDARTKKRGYNFQLQLRTWDKQARAMEAYLAKHPDKPDIVIWKPVIYGLTRDERDWTMVQDRLGKTIVGRADSLVVGKTFELSNCLVGFHGYREVQMFALVTKQVSMADAEKLAGCKLPRHKPYCYEVIVD